MSEQVTIPEGTHPPLRRGLDGSCAQPGILGFFPLDTPRQMRFWTLRRPHTTIGRSLDCTIQLDNERVSRHHARITATPQGCTLVDCDSTNGVHVDGRRCQTHSLHGGEIIRVGSALFRFMPTGTAAEDCNHPLDDEQLLGGPALDRIRQLLDRAANCDLPVLVVGETGTGKELAAGRLHRVGARSARPFVAVNCAALPEAMVEGELFGHVKGAYTGAAGSASGLIRRADGGTLFLDEIGELPLPSQAKLLRVLQDRRVRPLGGTEAFDVDVRVVCATNRDLIADAQQGRFRQDLYARVAGLVVSMPPLSDRCEDIPLLALHFCEKHDPLKRSITVEALEQLCCRPWPFNVRELESAVRRALLLAGDGPQIDAEHFEPEPVRESTPSPSRRDSQDEPQPPPASTDADPLAIELQEALREHAGDPILAAKALGISRSQLYRRARKLGIPVAAFRP